MLQKRVENIKEESLDNKQEQAREQKPESLADIKERRKEAIGGGISKAAEKMRGLGGKLLGVLKRIGHGAEYVLVADKAVASGVDALDSAMDNAAYWTSAEADKVGEFVGEKYKDLGGWAEEKIVELKDSGHKAVENFSEKRRDAKERNQFLKEKYRGAEGEIKDKKKQEKSEIKASREQDKATKEQGAETERKAEKKKKEDAMWQKLQDTYGLSRKIQIQGVSSQEIMDKAA